MKLEKRGNRFQSFFENKEYVSLKNYLYNYLLRKRAVESVLEGQEIDSIIEIGTGLSPVMTKADEILYTDLSFTGLKTLKTNLKGAEYVEADGTSLPFKSKCFSHCISSEVIEHIANDTKALQEIARVTRPQGLMILTFPHRSAYFFNDDHYVNHYRRYDLVDITKNLKNVGFQPIRVQKVLGPLEKITMSLVILMITLFKKMRTDTFKSNIGGVASPWVVAVFKWINRFYMIFAWVDAKLAPLSMSSVLLIVSKKNSDHAAKESI